MRITRHARSAAILLAAALFLAALPAWADDSVPAPVADSPGAETPSRSWNLVDGALDAPEASPDRDRIRSRLAARPRRLPSRPQVAPAPPEPPSFGELDRFVPPNARASLRESWQRWSPEVESGLKRGYGALPDEAQRRLARIGELALRPAGRRGLLAALVALGILLVALRTLRGHGDLVVCIAYPDDLRGSFTVMISQRKPRTGRAPRSERDAAHGRVSSRTEHHLVARETQFRGLVPGRYWITVDGDLFAGAGEDPIEQPFESQLVQVRSRDTHRVEFDLRPRSCPVEVRAVWDRQTLRDCSIAARGRPDTLRHTRGQSVRIGLPMGRHVIAVGSGDRVAEREIDVDDYSAQIVEVDLGAAEGVLFKGCPPAVAPYLQGDVPSAARALAREGQDKISNLLLARMHLEQGNRSRSAEHFEYAGHFRDAARLREELSDWTLAASLYEKAGEPVRSGEMYRRAGDPARAGQAYEAASELELALDCYREAGDVERMIGVLERRGSPFDAAVLARDHGDRSRAIKLLQQVPADDAHYTEACLLLVDELESAGHVDLAAHKLHERLELSGAPAAAPELRSRLAELWERSGNLPRALDSLEKLREEEPTWPELSTRIEALRKRLSADRSIGAGGSAPGGATQPPAESRYEILEQIGAGGMGVVFRARDRRLGREVALKRLPDNLRDHPTAVELFLREARAAAALNHPNIVTIHDADQENGTFFITMELLEGDPLHVILRRVGRLTARDCARLGVQICAGLAYAHERRIVHRDIKTSNLFFTRGKVVKIMDFGLAKMLEEVRRAATVIGGTPYYMAPEQAAGGSIDARADLYALGVTFFELATGGVPYREGDVVYHHRHSPVPDPRERVAGIPDGLAELILQLLAKNPADRCAGADEVAARLAAFTG
jgi:tRNA A-37 threonylcarbamoyl transferase component Bud32